MKGKIGGLALATYLVACVVTLFLPDPYKQTAIAIEFVIAACGLISLLIVSIIHLLSRNR